MATKKAKHNREGEECPHCKEANLGRVRMREAYNPDYYICEKCDSTYTLDDPRLKNEIQNNN